jgi:hypothetical protein
VSYPVISDIHANLEALQAVLRRKESLDADFDRVERSLVAESSHWAAKLLRGCF